MRPGRTGYIRLASDSTKRTFMNTFGEMSCHQGSDASGQRTASHRTRMLVLPSANLLDIQLLEGSFAIRSLCMKMVANA